ncbi:protein KTI12 homolog [Nematostella vectensis]|uniref:protein KTI12 homolog n=1 Tax=Nematostella vectensis TaxID=45351 RepID=UPI0013906981|nr:protein KTI12 homolog [Nematostella vectensis]
MPLIVITGFPCSGKTKRVEGLKEFFEKKDKSVAIINDDYAEVDRSSTYSDSSYEKAVRGTLRSAVERLISRDNIVILDSLNYIKGFRYELYCNAKAHKSTLCVIHCDTPEDVCIEWNRSREKGYPEDILRALVMRYECPDSRNRWDSPLFTVHPDDELPLEAIYETLINRVPPPPNQATLPQPISATNFMYELDRITQEIVTNILNAQKTFVPGDSVAVPGTTQKITLPRQVNMAELRRTRRQFITYTKMHPVEDTTKIANMFVQYINNCIH